LKSPDHQLGRMDRKFHMLYGVVVVKAAGMKLITQQNTTTREFCGCFLQSRR
jgi:hypothetical protein